MNRIVELGLFGAGCNATSAVESTTALLVVLAVLLRLRRRCDKRWKLPLPLAAAMVIAAVAPRLSGPAAAEAPAPEVLVYFDRDEVKLDDAARARLATVAATLKSNRALVARAATVEGAGYTHEQDLVHARATNVRAYLIGAGVAAQRVLLPIDEMVASERERPVMRLLLVSRAEVEDEAGPKLEASRPVVPQVTEVTRYVYVVTTEEIVRPFRFALTGGAGLVRSIDGVVGLGGMWNLRLTAGTRSPLAGELAYLATVQQIDGAMGYGDGALLMSHGAEGALRMPLFDASIQPYAFAGAGFARFDVVDAEREVDGDTVVFFPVGIGAAHRAGRLVFDLRGTVRAAFDDEMFARASRPAELDNWSLTLTAGAEL